MGEGPLRVSFKGLDVISSFSREIWMPSKESRQKKRFDRVKSPHQKKEKWNCDGDTCRARLGFAATVSLLHKQRKKMKVHHSCGLILGSPNRQPGQNTSRYIHVKKHSTFTDMEASSPWGGVTSVRWCPASAGLELMQCPFWLSCWTSSSLPVVATLWGSTSTCVSYEDSRCCGESPTTPGSLPLTPAPHYGALDPTAKWGGLDTLSSKPRHWTDSSRCGGCGVWSLKKLFCFRPRCSTRSSLLTSGWG